MRKSTFLLFQSLGVFGLCQIMAFIAYLQSSMSKEHFETLFRFLFLIVLAILGVGLGVLTLSGKVAPWTGRSIPLSIHVY